MFCLCSVNLRWVFLKLCLEKFVLKFLVLRTNTPVSYSICYQVAFTNVWVLPRPQVSDVEMILSCLLQLHVFSLFLPPSPHFLSFTHTHTTYCDVFFIEVCINGTAMRHSYDQTLFCVQLSLKPWSARYDILVIWTRESLCCCSQ